MDLGLRDGARDGGGFGVDEGSGIAADVHGFRGLAKIKLDVYGIGLLRNDSQILKNFLFETFLLNAERVTTGSEGAKRQRTVLQSQDRATVWRWAPVACNDSCHPEGGFIPCIAKPI